MSKRAGGRWNVLAQIAIAFAACVAFLGGTVAARGLLAEEAEQARWFVTEGQSALARKDRAGAALAFKRARWLAPRLEMVRTAIEAAGVRDAEPVLSRALRLMTSREWSAIAIAAGWVSALGMAFIVSRRPRKLARWVTLSAALAFAVAMGGVMQATAASPAIVTGNDTPWLVAPCPTAAVEASLRPGTMVIVGSSYDTFVHVEDGEGIKGCVARSSVERIASPES